MSDKYICFKVEEWDLFVKNLSTSEALVEEWANAVMNLLPEPVADAEVFRHQDRVSAPIFYAASSIYQSYLELVIHDLNPEQQEYMRDVVEHFFVAADKSKALPNRKLPD